jgi:hypothetical protein
MFVRAYDEEGARRAVETSQSYAEALRKLGLGANGGNHRLFRRYVDEVWRIPTEHFDPRSAQRRGLQNLTTPLEDVLVEGSSYSRTDLKRRLFETGIKTRECELCGQGEVWRGAQMSMILDHINGVPNDNRLDNLRVVCPNCAATFETHCGRKNRRPPTTRACALCGTEFHPHSDRQRYCSRDCGCRHSNRRRDPVMSSRRVERPEHAQLIAELANSSYVAVARKYGVSDGTVRKWIRWYEAAAARSEEKRDEAA